MEEWSSKHLDVRTDLAVEERERFPGDGGEVSGVRVKTLRKTSFQHFFAWNFRKAERLHIVHIFRKKTANMY
mgnify:CR=1 FL=1